MNKRKSAQASIKRTAERVQGVEAETWDIIRYKTELEMFEGFWNQYSNAHEQLVAISINDDEIDVHHGVMTAQSDIYMDTMVLIKRKIYELERVQVAAAALANTVVTSPPAVSAQSTLNVNNTDEVNRFLEKIKVPKFNGEQHKWLAFYSSFKSMVHDKNYSSIEKFHYLYNSLIDRARHVIGGLDTADSYEEAWKTLVKRYDNKRLLVNAHLQHFVNFQLSSRPGSNDLLSLVDVTLLTTRSLRTMEVPIEGWDAILVHLISRKLDDKTREFWETEQKSTDIPTLQNMLDCIESRARTLQLAEEAKGTANASRSNTNNNQRQQQGRPTAAVNTTVATTNLGTTPAGCLLCKQDHWLHRCPQLTNAPVDTRFNLIKGIPNLCFNCLRVGHVKIECRSSGCKHCPDNQRHNTLLCRRGAQTAANSYQLALASTSHNA